jgi:hypothetical protein
MAVREERVICRVVRGDSSAGCKVLGKARSAYRLCYILASPYAYHGEEIVEKKIWRTIKFVMLQHITHSTVVTIYSFLSLMCMPTKKYRCNARTYTNTYIHISMN